MAPSPPERAQRFLPFRQRPMLRNSSRAWPRFLFAGSPNEQTDRGQLVRAEVEGTNTRCERFNRTRSRILVPYDGRPDRTRERAKRRKDRISLESTRSAGQGEYAGCEVVGEGSEASDGRTSNYAEEYRSVAVFFVIRAERQRVDGEGWRELVVHALEFVSRLVVRPEIVITRAEFKRPAVMGMADHAKLADERVEFIELKVVVELEETFRTRLLELWLNECANESLCIWFVWDVFDEVRKRPAEATQFVGPEHLDDVGREHGRGPAHHDPARRPVAIRVSAVVCGSSKSSSSSPFISSRTASCSGS